MRLEKRPQTWLERLLARSIVFLALLFGLFFILRLWFVFYLGVWLGAAAEAAAEDYFATFLNALRYESRSCAAIALVYFLLGAALFWTRRREAILRGFATFAFFFVSFIYLAEVVFYEIYADGFNANLLGLIYDDREAIFKTGLGGSYSIAPKVILAVLLGLVFRLAFRKLAAIFEGFLGRFQGGGENGGGGEKFATRGAKTHAKNASKIRGFAVPAALFVIFGLSVTFSINSAFKFSVREGVDTTIKPVANTFLRNATPGAFRNLYIVYKGHKKSRSSAFSDYHANSPREVVESYFGLGESSGEIFGESGANLGSAANLGGESSGESTPKNAPYDLQKLLERRVQSDNKTKISHIFLIYAESLSEWHFDERFAPLGLVSGMRGLLEKGGVKADVFLQNAGSTAKSLDVLLSGLIQTEIPPSTMIGRLKPFVTSSAAIFRGLGYAPNFYYGGSGTWQGLDKYTIAQGFERIFYNTHIVEHAKSKSRQAPQNDPPFEGVWGAYDHFLFDFVRENTLKTAAKKTFNVILTTSYHPPYDVNLEDFAVPLGEIEDFLAKNTATLKEKTPRMPRVLGHIYYADKQITRFIETTAAALPNSLFIITGDHYDREIPLRSPPLRLLNSIPLIIYSPVLKPRKLAKVGSHIDIAPTIVELVAPKNHAYHSFGRPLFTNDRELAKKKVAHKFGVGLVATSGESARGVALQNDAQNAAGAGSAAKNEAAQNAPQNAAAREERDVALGYFGVATERFFFDKNGAFDYFGERREGDELLAKNLYKRLNEARALSWWILMKGYEVE